MQALEHECGPAACVHGAQKHVRAHLHTILWRLQHKAEQVG